MTDSKENRFNSLSSPYSKRKLFLSEDMLKNEDYHVYEISYWNTVLSLKESQGFIFNQDFFADPHQQQRCLENERARRKAMSKGSKTDNTTKRENTSSTIENDGISTLNIDDNTHEHATDDEDTSDKQEEEDESDDESNNDYYDTDTVFGASIHNRNCKVIARDIELNEDEADIYPE